MVLPVLLGAASAASGIMSAFGQQQSAEAEVRGNNKLKMAQYRQNMANYQFNVASMKRNWEQDLAIWDAKKKQYNFQVQENNRAAGQAYYKNNVALTRIQDRAKGDALDSFIQLMEANADDAVKGQTGRRSGMRRQSNLMARGMEMRRRADSLAYADQNTRQANEDVRTRVRIDNQNAWYNVSVAPRAPLVPPGPMSPLMQSMPSRMGMYGSFLSSAVGGASTVNSLTPGGIF
jgi:hypothetical protein